jgi:hypothetical protein
MSPSNPIIRTTVAVLLCGSYLTAQPARQSTRTVPKLSNTNSFAQTKVSPKITAIRAQLFYEPTGTFSEDILAKKDFALWNTIIGEGSADAASTSTLVTVEISGRHLPVGGTKVEITPTGKKNRLIQKKLVSVDIYDERTKFYAPLWLNDTGCEPIKIAARLIGSGAPTGIITKTIPFACGE